MVTNFIILAMAAQLVSFSASGDAPEISFSLVRDSLVVVPVFLNGQGPFRFLLDTGATHSILSTAVADQLRIPTGSRGALITAGGSVPVTVRVIEAVQIGSVRIGKTTIAVSDAEILRTLHVDGIIGADYLKQFRISIDYVHHVLSLQQ
jgi:predicted aspartyl protease